MMVHIKYINKWFFCVVE